MEFEINWFYLINMFHVVRFSKPLKDKFCPVIV